MAGERGWRNLRLYSDLSGAYSRDYFDILADGSEVGAFNVFTRRDHPPLLVRRDYRLDRRPRPAHGAFPIQPRCGWCWTARRKGVAAIGIRSWTTTPDGGSYIAIRTACRRIRMTSAADFPTTTEFAHWASVSVALCMEADLGQCPRYGSNPVSRMTASGTVLPITRSARASATRCKAAVVEDGFALQLCAISRLMRKAVALKAPAAFTAARKRDGEERPPR
jgi:hypothetical protein